MSNIHYFSTDKENKFSELPNTDVQKQQPLTEVKPGVLYSIYYAYLLHHHEFPGWILIWICVTDSVCRLFKGPNSISALKILSSSIYIHIDKQWTKISWLKWCLMSGKRSQWMLLLYNLFHIQATLFVKTFGSTFIILVSSYVWNTFAISWSQNSRQCLRITCTENSLGSLVFIRKELEHYLYG